MRCGLKQIMINWFIKSNAKIEISRGKYGQNVKEAIDKMVENARKTGTIYCPGGYEVTREECHKCSQCKPSLWSFVDSYEV